MTFGYMTDYRINQETQERYQNKEKNIILSLKTSQNHLMFFFLGIQYNKKNDMTKSRRKFIRFLLF